MHRPPGKVWRPIAPKLTDLDEGLSWAISVPAARAESQTIHTLRNDSKKRYIHVSFGALVKRVRPTRKGEKEVYPDEIERKSREDSGK